VVPIGEDAAFTLDLMIHRASHSDGQTLHAARQGPAIRRFRNQVHMIALHRKMDKTESEPLARKRERGSHSFEEPMPSERGHAPHELQGDVHRMVPRVRRTAQVRDTGGGAIRSTASAGARSTPTAKPEPELLTAKCHDHFELALIVVLRNRLFLARLRSSAATGDIPDPSDLGDR